MKLWEVKTPPSSLCFWKTRRASSVQFLHSWGFSWRYSSQSLYGSDRFDTDRHVARSGGLVVRPGNGRTLNWRKDQSSENPEDPAVERAGETLTMQLGPQQVLLTAKIKFRGPLKLAQLESAIVRIKKRIRETDPGMGRIFIEADCLAEPA